MQIDSRQMFSLVWCPDAHVSFKPIPSLGSVLFLTKGLIYTVWKVFVPRGYTLKKSSRVGQSTVANLLWSLSQVN